MKFHLYILGIYALVGVTGCRSSNSVDKVQEYLVPDATIESRLESEIRKDSLLQYLQAADFCNARKGNVVSEESMRLQVCAHARQNIIEGLLEDEAQWAFHDERLAYQAWNGHQQMMSDIVVSKLWDTFAGGSAGGSYQVVYLYDIENLNCEDMDHLLFHLLKLPGETFGDSTPPTIEQFREQWNLFVCHTLPTIHEKSDYKEVLFVIAEDAHLFSAWIKCRERLTRALPKEVAAAYTRITKAIINDHSSKYRESFIGDEDIIKRALQNE